MQELANMRGNTQSIKESVCVDGTDSDTNLSLSLPDRMTALVLDSRATRQEEGDPHEDVVYMSRYSKGDL
jgi:hypothetical protein